MPRDSSGMLSYGCVYRSVFSIKKAVYAAAAAHNIVQITEEPFVCVHVRSGDVALLNGTLDLYDSPEYSECLTCVDDFAMDAADWLPMFVFADTNRMSEALVGALDNTWQLVLTTGLIPEHSAGLGRNISASDIRRAYLSSFTEWLLMSRCSYLFLGGSGFSRTAAVWGAVASAAGYPAPQKIFLYKDKCTMLEGVTRDSLKGLGSGF